MEGAQPEECTAYVDELRINSAHFRGRIGHAVGQYTDDSQLARELMISYAALGRFDPSDYAERIRLIFAEDRIVGRGFATDAAAQRLIAGVPWEQAGTPAPQAGNGTAMRAAPVGLLFGDDPAEMIRVAHDQGRITHKDARCSAGSVAIAGAVALAARPDKIEVKRFVQQLSEWMSAFDKDFARCVLQLTKWMELRPEEVAPTISSCASGDFSDGWKWISPFVVPSVLWSLYSFLRTPEDYWETICTAIVAGGDVDTTAAMAGAISGAHVGLQGVPRELACLVKDGNLWGFQKLVDLSSRCYHIKTAGDRR
jgi:poly(ADP-ribose) glycohydrolase ARH3